MVFRFTSTQVITSGRFWIDVLVSALQRHHQKTKRMNIFWKNGVPSLQEISRDLSNQSQGAACGGPTSYRASLSFHL